MLDSPAPAPPGRRAALVAAMRSYLGTRFHHQGRLPGIGLDCGGSIVVAGRAAGYEMVDMQGYSRRPDGRTLRETIEANCEAVPRGRDGSWPVQPGDVLLFAFDGVATHVGLQVDERYFVHAHFPARRVIETALDATWRSRLVGVFRFPE